MGSSTLPPIPEQTALRDAVCTSSPMIFEVAVPVISCNNSKPEQLERTFINIQPDLKKLGSLLSRAEVVWNSMDAWPFSSNIASPGL